MNIRDGGGGGDRFCFLEQNLIEKRTHPGLTRGAYLGPDGIPHGAQALARLYRFPGAWCAELGDEVRR